MDGHKNDAGTIIATVHYTPCRKCASVVTDAERERGIPDYTLAHPYSRTPAPITSAELAEQRREFALDGAEDRPYHHIAHARNKRGLPWSLSLGRREGSYPRTRANLYASSQVGTPGWRAELAESERWARFYVSEAPFLRTRVAGDGERWVQALRRGR